MTTPHPSTPSRRARGSRLPRVLIALGLTVVVAACSSAAAAPPLVPGESFTVVADLQPLADLAQQVSGDRAEVVPLVPAGLDGHTYEPRPSDVTTIARTHLFLANGGGLNPAVEGLAERNLPEGSPLVRLADVTLREDELLYTDTHAHGGGPAHGHTGNVHLWTNVPYAIRYVDQMATSLAERDPDGVDTYRANADALVEHLEALDDAIGQAIATIPAEDRKLVVYHDSWSYFGRNYGIEVIGAIQPADFSEPSAAELRSMVQQIRAEDVPAFFGSEVFPSDVLETVARESGADYVGDLNDDRLPREPGDPSHSYVGMMVANTRTIVEALGGDPSALDAVAPS